MSTIAHALVSALYMAFAMGWEILWPLILGFALSGIVQAVVTKGEMTRLLPDSSLHSIVIATAFGAASSSCSYAAVALARSMFRKGAELVAAMAFQFASTNLVFELGIILAVLIGWQFVAAAFVGGLKMVALLTVMLRAVMSPRLIEEARRQAAIAEKDEEHRIDAVGARPCTRTASRSRPSIASGGLSGSTISPVSTSNPPPRWVAAWSRRNGSNATAITNSRSGSTASCRAGTPPTRRLSSAHRFHDRPP